MKPTQPTVRAVDGGGNEFWLDANGLAFRADCSRVPELDGPPLHAPLDRGEVARVLAESFRRDRRLQCATELLMSANRLDARCNAYAEVADALSLTAEFDAMIAGEVQP